VSTSNILIKSSLESEILGQVEDELNNLNLPDKPDSLFEPVKYALESGGKRVRPFLTLLSCGMTGGCTSDALKAAVAVELLHNFTLIHDDIMDKADLRRGKPAIHKKWDQSTAILAGDYLFAKSFDLINYYGDQSWVSKEQFSLLHKYFLQGVKVVCEGQAKDMELEKADNALLDDYLSMITCKTSALLGSALQIGGIIANSDNHSLKYLGSIGIEVGNAFQIQDDLLDIIGSADTFGKKIGGDITARKKTYLSILAFKRADEFQKRKLLRILQKHRLNASNLSEIIDIYEDLDIIKDAKRAVKFHYESAVELVDVFDESKFKSNFLSLLKKLLNRKS